MPHAHDQRLARTLILDELFDLSLYKALRDLTKPDTQQVLDELIVVETGHLAFWQLLRRGQGPAGLHPGEPASLW